MIPKAATSDMLIYQGCCKKSRYEVRYRVPYTVVDGENFWDRTLPWQSGFKGQIIEIRAHQGHSVRVLVESQRLVGEWLGLYIVYHGTKRSNLESIFAHGIVVGWGNDRKDVYMSAVNQYLPDEDYPERDPYLYWIAYPFSAEVLIAISVRAAEYLGVVFRQSKHSYAILSSQSIPASALLWAKDTETHTLLAGKNWSLTDEQMKRRQTQSKAASQARSSGASAVATPEDLVIPSKARPKIKEELVSPPPKIVAESISGVIHVPAEDWVPSGGQYEVGQIRPPGMRPMMPEPAAQPKSLGPTPAKSQPPIAPAPTPRPVRPPSGPAAASSHTQSERKPSDQLKRKQRGQWQ